MKVSTNELKILKALRYKFLSIKINNTNMNKEVIANKTKINISTTDHCLNQLLIDGYITETIHGTADNPYFELSPKGNNLLDQKSHELKSKILWNVITPIFLSIITTLITLWLTSLSK